MSREPIYYKFPTPWVAISLVAAAMTVAAILHSPWWLCGFPFAYLGIAGGQPNLNLADGCLTWIILSIAAITLIFSPMAASVIGIPTFLAYTLSALERGLRAVPVFDPAADDIEDA